MLTARRCVGADSPSRRQIPHLDEAVAPVGEMRTHPAPAIHRSPALRGFCCSWARSVAGCVGGSTSRGYQTASGVLATLVRVDLAVTHTVTTIVERGSEASAWPPLLIAVVGGSVGFLLGAMARALGIPKDVRLHDAAVADRDEALATWVADRDHELRRICKELRATVAVSPDEELPERLDKTPPLEAVGPLRQRAIAPLGRRAATFVSAPLRQQRLQ